MDDKEQLLEQLHEILFEMLCKIDDYCKENNITYFLSGGTCLGAVRHKGFIPWDDDADLMMPRPDYDRFVKGFASAYPDKYAISSLEIDPQWVRDNAQIWDMDTLLIMNNIEEKEKGVFIDVFPIDGLPNAKWMQKVFYKGTFFINFVRNARIRKGFYSTEKHIALKKIVGLLVKPFSGRFLTELITKWALRYDYDKSKYVGVSTALKYGDKETQPKENMSRAVMLEFNGRDFPVPVGYDAYLSGLYGDYMAIPKGAAESGSHHLEGHEFYFGKENFPKNK